MFNHIKKIIGGGLDLTNTKITSLPDNLIVGGGLDISGTEITSLPDNLTVGGGLNISDTKITKEQTKVVNRQLTKEQYMKINAPIMWKRSNRQYIKIDGVFSELVSHRNNIYHVRLLTGKEMVVVTDGEGHYAHGNTLKEAKEDLIFKITERDKGKYEGLSLSDELTYEEAIVAYRTITGACAVGTRDYIDNRLPKKKAKYTIQEIIDLTENEYGGQQFKEFFMGKERT